jgi:proline iminopeptidase
MALRRRLSTPDPEPSLPAPARGADMRDGQTHWLRLILAIAGAAVLALVTGIAAMLGVAANTSQAAVFLSAGLVVFCAVYLAGLLLATRTLPPDRREPIRARSFILGTVVVTGAFAVTALRPMADPRLEPAAVPGQGFWDLPDGSRIAYVRIPAEGNAQTSPVFILHGGPGVPDMAGDAAYFGRLARDGFDVYVYDQVGSGRSTRLADVRGYTLERDVADLEAIRRLIGVDQVILLGHSYGGKLAAAYAAAHSEHVARLVLTSPDDPSPAAGGASMTFRLPLGSQLDVYALLIAPRPLFAWALLQVNPAAAHAVASDDELDARQDRVYNRTRPALHCRDRNPGPELHGLGFFANQYPQSASRAPHQDFLPALSGSDIPTLIVKGRCDYLSWSSAVSYLQALPASRLIYFDDAGHNVYQDEPDRYLALIRAFLLGQPLPESPYTGTGPPPNYEGPR